MRFLSAVILFAAFAVPTLAQEKPFDAKPPIQKTYATGRIAPPKAALKAAHAQTWKKYGLRITMAANRLQPEAYDCADFGLVPPVKDQGGCGSCHIFSACGPATCALIKAGQLKLSSDGLSEQYLIDCHRQLGGCNGGWEWEDAKVLLATGAPLESEYGPYQARAGNCKPVTKFYKISDMGMCSEGDGVAKTEDMKACIIAYGPISVAVAADNQFSNHKSGLFDGSGSRQVNHAVMITGWKTANGKTYWKVRNSWSATWCENGYIWMREGANQIGDSAFWCKAEPVTPPDPGPTPPGPVPPFPDPMSGTITLSSDLAKGLYKIVPKDAEIVHGGMTVNELTDVLERLRKGREAKPCCDSPAARPVEDTRVDRIEARLEAIERTNAALVTVLEKMTKQMEKAK